VNFAGTGTGTVTSSPAGLNCTNSCKLCERHHGYVDGGT
jgi:wyosine [tRNA(Phe)-imidazoG37] synthetase (radical SAM superfamily)